MLIQNKSNVVLLCKTESYGNEVDFRAGKTVVASLPLNKRTCLHDKYLFQSTRAVHLR